MILKKRKKIGPPNEDGIEQTADYYSKIYMKPYPKENYDPIFNKVMDCISKLDVKNCRVLDIGCGIGELARRLREKGFRAEQYFGFDFSEKGIQVARQNNMEWSHRFYVHNCYNLDKIRFDYDLAVAIEVLEHIQDLKVLPKLKTGAFFIGSVPNFWASGNAHLRVYPNKNFIRKRFNPYLEFRDWHRHRYNKYRFIYTFLAEKK